MTPDLLRTVQNQINAPVVAATVGVLRRTPTGRLSPEGWLKLLSVLYPVVTQNRAKSVALSRRFYASQNPDGTAPRVDAPDYDLSMLNKTLGRYAREGLEKIETRQTAVAQGAAAVARHVEQAGREWTALATNADNVKYARYDPMGETCAFCKLLVSRGPCYLSETSGAFQSHPHCTCVAVPVFNEDSWPGRDQFLRAEKLYVEVTGPYTGKDKLRAFRRAVEA